MLAQTSDSQSFSPQFVGSDVRRQLDAAYFMRKIFECELERSALAELECIRPQLDELEKELLKARGNVSRILYENLGDPENPLNDAFVRIISDVREKTTRRLVTLKNIREMSLPKGFRLRPTQGRFLEKLQAYFEDGQKRSGFVKYPTGMGKTVLIGLMIRSFMENEFINRVLVLSPRSIINRQNLETITALQDKKRKIKVNEIRQDSEHKSEIHVGTYQLAAAHMGGRKPKAQYAEQYDVIFLDECHRSFGAMFMRFLRLRHPESIIIGLSATPYVGRSLDPRRLKSAFRYFEGEIDSITLKEACEEGALPPIRAFRIEVNCEDYTEEDRTDEQLLDKLNLGARVVIAKRLVKEHIPAGEKTLIFCAGVEHAKRTAAAIGKKAAVVHGNMTKTQIKSVLARNKRGEINVLTTADLLIEGFDDAQIKHIIILRPTMSMWIYEQMIGRGTRIDPDDPNKMLTIWDVVGQHSQQCTIHGLHKLYGDHQEAVRTGDILFGKEPEKRGKKDVQIEKFEKEDWGGFAEIMDVLLIEDVAPVLIPRDGVYYHNSENVRDDLEEYAKAMEKMVGLLTTAHIGVSIQCSNGETVKWQTYLKNAAICLGLAKNSAEAQLRMPLSIERLKEIAGVDFIRRDMEYYQNRGYIHADLESYAKVMGEEVVALIPATTSRGSIEVQCSNGETVKWFTYLRQAVVCLGFAESTAEAHSYLTMILKRLKEIAGIKVLSVKRDREYYLNAEYVKADLDAYAAVMKRDVIDLSVNHGKSISIQCSNGENVKWNTYLMNAGQRLDLAEDSKFFKSKTALALKRLKELSGCEVITMKRDKAYYENKEYVKADLDAYAEAKGQEVKDLSGTNQSISVKCSNGETVKWVTYYKSAAVCLGLAKNTSEAGAKSKLVLERLKKIAGLKILSIKRDKNYYGNKEYVKADLEAFAQLSGQKVNELTTSFPTRRIVCRNGESVRWATYVMKAGVSFGLANNFIEARSKFKIALKRLQQVAGIEVKVFSVKREMEYYLNQEYVRADLEAYAQVMGKDVADLATTHVSLSVQCSNGEVVKWGTYVNNASRCLGFARNFKETKSCFKQTLKKLKEIAGVV